MAKFYIEYRAANDSMGDTSSANCDAYREWAEEQLRAAYPDHEISVCNKPSLHTVLTDDCKNQGEIEEFCHHLWDSCPWEKIGVKNDDHGELDLTAPLPDLLRAWMNVRAIKTRQEAANRLNLRSKRTLDGVLDGSSSGAEIDGLVRRCIQLGA